MKVEISDLIGKTIVKIGRIDMRFGNDDALLFYCSDGSKYRMSHERECCEAVSIEDICGDLNDLTGEPIVIAEEISNHEPTSEEDIQRMLLVEEERFICNWTFYKLATRKGYVTIRWYGESNGYYSVGVDFQRVD